MNKRRIFDICRNFLGAAAGLAIMAMAPYTIFSSIFGLIVLANCFDWTKYWGVAKGILGLNLILGVIYVTGSAAIGIWLWPYFIIGAGILFNVPNSDAKFSFF